MFNFKIFYAYFIIKELKENFTELNRFLFLNIKCYTINDLKLLRSYTY